MNKAVFIDRDGVINEDNGYVCKKEDFYFFDGIFDFCRTAQEKGYLLIVVTNQAGIARGYYSESEFLELNNWMLEVFSQNGIAISKVYYCPFHRDGIGEYKKESNDRKPNPGMLLKARKEFDIDFHRSMLIGDKDSDIEAGLNAGLLRLIFLQGKYKLSKNQGIVVLESISDAVQYL